MNLILTADWHLTSKNPRIRTDDYPFTQLKKASWICRLANDEDAAIVIAGDLFDRPSFPIPLLHTYMRLFNSVENGVYVIYGQHDLHFHNPDITRTPLGLLLEAGAVKYADHIGFDCRDYGVTLEEPDSKMLCIHAPITRYDPPFYMKDAVSAKQFLKMHPEYQFVVSGDWHESFVYEEKGAHLFNPGPIMRPSKDKVHFEPRVILLKQLNDIPYDWEWINIPIKTDVFDLDLMDKDDLAQYREEIRELAAEFDYKENTPRFWDNVDKVVAEIDPSQMVKDKINEIKDRIDG